MQYANRGQRRPGNEANFPPHSNSHIPILTFQFSHSNSDESRFAFCYCNYFCFCFSSPGHTDVLLNQTAKTHTQHGVHGLPQSEASPPPPHGHVHRDTPATLTISHHDQKAPKQPSPIAEEDWEEELHRRSTDVDQIMPSTYSTPVMWNSWISDFNDDDDSSECV